MNKGLIAIIAAAALAATKGMSSKKEGSFYLDSLTDRNVFDILGSDNKIKSFEDFMDLDEGTRQKLKIQASYIVAEATNSDESILPQGFTIDDLLKAKQNQRFRKSIVRPAIRKANKRIKVMIEQQKFKVFKNTSPTRKNIQRKRNKPQLVPDAILGDLCREEYDSKDSEYTKDLMLFRKFLYGDSRQSGIMDKLYKSKEYMLNPNLYVSFVRLMCTSFYQSYPIMYKGVSDKGTSQILKATQDSYVYNPLTDEYGPVTSLWASSVLDKMVHFKSISDSVAITPQYSSSQRSIRFAFLNLYEFYTIPELYDSLVHRWQDNRNLSSVIMKDLHFLVFSTMYKMSRDYLNSELFSFGFFSDLSGQNLLPFGNSSFESYKETIASRMEGKINSTYKYNIIPTENLYTEDIAFDGFGSLFDRITHKGWSYLLSQIKSNETFKDNIIKTDYSLYFTFHEGDTLTVSYSNSPDALLYESEFNYQIENKDYTGYPKDQFNQFMMVFKNKELRSSIFGTGMMSLLVDSPYAILGFPANYGEEDPVVVCVDNFLELDSKIPRIGAWASECTIQLSKVVNSGQIQLAMYLMSPIMNYTYLDTEARKYNLPLSMYPSNIKEKLSKQQKEAIKNKYVDPERSYQRGTVEIDVARSMMKQIIERITQIGLEKKFFTPETMGRVLASEFELPFSRVLWKYEICPDKQMDWGRPTNYSQKKLIRKRYYRYEPNMNWEGIPIHGELIPYFIDASEENRERTKNLKTQSEKAQKLANSILRLAEEAGVSRVVNGARVWDDNNLELNEDQKNLTNYIFELAKKAGSLKRNPIIQEDKLIWAGKNLETKFAAAQRAEYMNLCDNKTYTELMEKGKPVYNESDYRRYEFYKKFAADGHVNLLKKIINQLSRTYSATTAQISNSSFNRVVGLAFGGSPSDLVVPQDYNPFLKYYENIQREERAIPTQRLTSYGIDMVATVRAVDTQRYEAMERQISSKRDEAQIAIADGTAREGSLEDTIVKLISSSLKKSSDFGVPYLKNENVKKLFGIKMAEFLGSTPSRKMYFYSRDGQIERLSGYVPHSDGDMSFVSIDKDAWNKRREVAYVDDYIATINAAQSIFLGSYLQELFSRFSVKTSNYGDIGALENDQLKFYTKVKKVGGQLAVLGDDPLGFREMYQNLSEHSTSLEKKKSFTIDVRFDPSVILNKEIAKNSSFDEKTVSKVRKLIKTPNIQQLVNDKFSVQLSGVAEYSKSPQPIEKFILDNIGVFSALDDRRPSSRSESTKEEIADFYQQYDMYLKRIVDNIEKVSMAVFLYDFIVSRYGGSYLPVAEYDNMSIEDFKRLLSRYKETGVYRNFFGADEAYPQSYKDLVEKQIQAYEAFQKGVGSEPDFSEKYSSFEDRYKDNFNKSFVEKQSEKVGALITILPVGGGYRVYLPYKYEHIENIARAGNKSGNHSKIKDLEDYIGTTFNDSVYCIADHTTEYVKPWALGNIMHLVVVTPDGDLHSLMTFNADPTTKAPNDLQQWRANVGGDGVKGQPRILGKERIPTLRNPTQEVIDYYWNKMRLKPEEVLEIDSKIVREFTKFMKDWLKNPETILGERMPNVTVDGSIYSFTDIAKSKNWSTSSKVRTDLLKMAEDESLVDEIIDIGTLDTFQEETRKGWYSNINILYTLGDIAFVKKYYGPKSARLGAKLAAGADAISQERKVRIEKLKAKGKL